MEPIEFEAKATFEEYKAVHGRSIKYWFFVHRWPRLLCFVLAVVSLKAGMEQRTLALVAIILGCDLLYGYYDIAGSMRRAFAHSLPWQLTYKYKLSDAGIEMVSPPLHDQIDWTAIGRWSATADFFQLHVRTGPVLYIPKRMLTEPQRQALRDELKKRVPLPGSVGN